MINYQNNAECFTTAVSYNEASIVRKLCEKFSAYLGGLLLNRLRVYYIL